MKKSISNRTWLVLLCGLLALCALGAAAVYLFAPRGDIAVITLDGQVVERVELSKVRAPYELSLTGESGITDVVEIAPGRIRVREATCPDQVCVRRGWLEGAGAAPVVCLPNRLVISLSGQAEGDAVLG